MEQSLENKTEITSKFKNFYEKNKFKIYILISILVILVASFILIKHNKDKKNIFIAEKYVQAGIYLTSKQSDDAKNLYEEKLPQTVPIISRRIVIKEKIKTKLKFLLKRIF